MDSISPRASSALRVGWRALALCASVQFAAASGGAQDIALSPDVSIEVGALVVSDEALVVDPALGGLALLALGAPPVASEVTAYDLAANEDPLLCFATGVELPGPVIVRAGDVVRWSGSAFSVELDATANGVPAGVRCDALARDSAGRLWLSFDVAVQLPGGIVADDEDLVRLDAPGTWTLAFDGSAAGVAAGLDLDGASLSLTANLVLSFDGSGSLAGFDFDDEDALEYDPVNASWSLLYDSSAQDPAWAAADLDALPEPGALLAGTAGLVTVSALAWAERRRRREPDGLAPRPRTAPVRRPATRT